MSFLTEDLGFLAKNSHFLSFSGEFYEFFDKKRAILYNFLLFSLDIKEFNRDSIWFDSNELAILNNLLGGLKESRSSMRVEKKHFNIRE